MRFPAAILILALTRCKAASSDAAGGASGGERRPERPTADRPTAKVIPGVLAHLARGACYGPCPVYEVTVMQDGTVKYTGKTFVITEGAAEKRLTSEQLAELRAAFERARFFDVEMVQKDEGRPGSNDAFLYYSSGGRARRMDLPSGCDGTLVPKELLNLEVNVDRIVGTESWIGTAEQRKRFGDGYAH